MARFTPPVTTRLEDDAAESVRRNHEQRLGEFAAFVVSIVMSDAKVISGVVIPDASDVLVAHGLGRAPKMVIVSPARNANSVGMIREFRGRNPFTGALIDSTQVVCLRADAFVTAITIDVLVL